ncbi:ralA-binding protein 1-like [Rhagoletis pomonella]|uniref:ralA-binding protein 1-like n=1 Tax=Rhagoletis pomonella TaxID=28610 RepID=UPI001780239C|nr:ralA-binding protein 1-like [Rhagoletis pomonella]XP_036342721.1 ralA-binding protein 1-like [Rhagoletis pomonella]
MDFDSPDVEKDFPGLYASEGGDGKSKKSKEDSDYSESDHDKLSKKDLLIGRRKDKKDKGKDRGYAALEGESSPEEDLDAKSPSKSKKSKAFKFASSKSKEKREKSRDKEKSEKEAREDEKPQEKVKTEKEKDHKKKDKERKEKEKKEKSKDKEKDKDKKDKKAKQVNNVSVEVLELGDVQPVFGVSVSLATERSRCHDGVDLPLVVRDCIDYLQEHALKSDQIYKVEPLKTRIQHFKRLYNNRERQPETDELDIPTACALLKLFLRELPEPILTTDLISRFEDAASINSQSKQQEELKQLLELLPSCNRTLLSWIQLHFNAVILHGKHNKLTTESLAMLLSPPMQMSHRLLVALLSQSEILFADMTLIKYIPPITASSPKLPETPEDIQVELRKQESLLAQIHAEMNAGFVSKKREEQLWEVQRIITQLKRKLRSFEKRQEKSMEESQTASTCTLPNSSDTTDSKSTQPLQGCDAPLVNGSAKTPIKSVFIKDETKIKTNTKFTTESPETTATRSSLTHDNVDYEATDVLQNEPQNVIHSEESQLAVDGTHPDGFYIDEDSSFLMVPKTHPEYSELIRLQLESQELLAWKNQLQARITAERAEVLRLKQQHQQLLAANCANVASDDAAAGGDGDYEKIIEHYIRENTLLEHKKQMLVQEIFDERRECIAMQVELALQKFKI